MTAPGAKLQTPAGPTPRSTETRALLGHTHTYRHTHTAHVCTHACIHMHTHAHMCKYGSHTCVHVHICTCAHGYTHVHPHTCMPVHRYIHACAALYRGAHALTCTHTCICTCSHMAGILHQTPCWPGCTRDRALDGCPGPAPIPTLYVTSTSPLPRGCPYGFRGG